MSVSASEEKLASDTQSCDGGSMCLELALEGERLCKAGDCRAGVAFFQAAIQAGTDDLRTLSAIYSQLGNAYFYLGDYAKAMQYHKHDLTLARTMGDKLGEAKASGNLGNTLKVMGKFSEAIQCCKRHLELARELGDRLSEGRALYNLGNVYHAQAKQLGRVGQSDPGHFPQEVRDCLLQAVTHYEENLALMRELGDRAGTGRACGNLGNTCYLLGDFARAIQYHTQRLQLAREAGDRAAERRANTNLANSHIFLGQFENAAEHYKRTLGLAEELGDAAVEAQACYSLGNTYTLLREYRAAEEFHARHLAAARRLQDRVGEGRAAWSLGNAHAALGNHEKALYYATEHYAISRELGDALGVATAQMNMADLRKVLGLPAEPAPAPPTAPSHAATAPPAAAAAPNATPAPAPDTPFSALRVRRQSMEQLALIQLTPTGKQQAGGVGGAGADAEDSPAENPAESFFDIVLRCQSARMDEQRAALCSSAGAGKENRPAPAPAPPTAQRGGGGGGGGGAGQEEAMLDMISSLQSERMDSQRAELPAGGGVGGGASLPGLRGPGGTAAKRPEDDFLDMIARVQGSRLDSQRTELGRARPAPAAPTPAAPPTPATAPEPRACTVPDDDFFALLMRAQATRMEDQRATIPLQENRQNKSGNSKK